MPFLFDLSNSTIAVSSLEGSIGFVNSATGQNAEALREIGANVSVLTLSDTLSAAATDKNEIFVYSANNTNPMRTIQTNAAILSLHWVTIGTIKYLLVSTADQKIQLFGLTADSPLWTFTGQGSVYSNPVVNGNSLYIDQKSYIAKISLSRGILEKRFATPGGAGTPFILDNILFCTSPKRLLYAFPL